MRHLFFICLATLPLACASKPPRVPQTAKPAPAPAPDEDIARFYRVGATQLGPVLKQGRLVLVGGRRVLVKTDGSVQHENVATPEPLQYILEVPTPKGPRLVGFGNEGVYRFDEPLGAATVLAHAILKPTEVRFGSIGVGPGVVQVRSFGTQISIDVDTGKVTSLQGAPEMASAQLEFVSMQNGIAKTRRRKILVTSDGGKTFKPLQLAEKERTPEAIWYEGELRFRRLDGIGWATLDFATATLHPVSSEAPQNESNLTRFVRTTRQDPLEIAASTGLLLDRTTALVAVSGLLARVDLQNGDIKELVDYLLPGELIDSGAPCNLTRAAKGAYCAFKIMDGSPAIFFVPIEAGKPLVPQREYTDATRFTSSPSGGILYSGWCTNEKRTNEIFDRRGNPYACVQQPDGTWKAFFKPNDVERIGYPGVGPLKNGLVAALITPPPMFPAEALSPYFTIVDAMGTEQMEPLFEMKGAEGVLSLDSNVVEDEHGVLRVAVSDEAGATYILEQKPGDKPIARRLEDQRWATLRLSHGVAVNEGELFLSNDAGASFVPIAAPPAFLAELHDLDDWRDFYKPARMSISEVGFGLFDAFRIGWSTSKQIANAQKVEGGLLIEVPQEEP